MSVPTAAGTRRVAGVSRRRPRSGPVRDRVGGWFDVITPPSSHMCGGREAAPRGGGGAVVGAGVGRPRCGTDWRGGEGPSECVYAHAYRRCAEALLRRTVVEHAEPVCPGLQTLPLRAAFAPTGAFGSACFVVSGRRWRGAPGDAAGYGMSLPSSPATRTVPATGFRPPAGVQARPPRAWLQRLCGESVLPSPAPGETATTPAGGAPTPGETATTPVPPQRPLFFRFGQAGVVGVSQNPQAGAAGAVGVSSSGPAAPCDREHGTGCRLSREAPTRWSTMRLEQGCGQGPDGGSDFAAVGWTGHNSNARRSQLAPVTPIRGS